MKKRCSIVYVVFISIFIGINLNGQASITQRNDIGGRLGDKFLAIVKALWLGHKYNITYLYNPSDYYKYFDIHTMHNNGEITGFADINNEQSINTNSSQIYRIDYYFKCNNWHDFADFFDWQDLAADTVFRDKLRTLFHISSFVPEIVIPNDRISVAVHVRKGSGGDFELDPDPKKSREKIRNVVTVRMPRDEFYIKEIIHMSELFNDAPMYVFIFTDHKDPEKIVQRYKSRVNKPNIIFDCRKNNSHINDAAVMDLAEMLRFDCLIRSMSNFGQMAHVLGNYKCVIYPLHASKIDGKLVVDSIRVMKD